jgi:hypothetical protein
LMLVKKTAHLHHRPHHRRRHHLHHRQQEDTIARVDNVYLVM